MTKYDYEELFIQANRPEATKEDRAVLADWCDHFDPDCWNGERYSLTEGLSLWPVYEWAEGEDGELEGTIVDYEIR